MNITEAEKLMQDKKANRSSPSLLPQNWLTRLRAWLTLPGLALGGLLLGGLGLRVWGQSNGLPYIIPSDEPLIVDAGSHILKSGDFDPQMYAYPSLYIYLQTLVYALAFIWGAFTGLYSSLDNLPDKTYAITTAPQIYVWGRWLTALIGMAGIAVAYFTVVKIWADRRMALLAAGFIAFSALAVENSHYITVDIPLATFALATLYPAWRLMEFGRRRDYLLSGVLAGLTIGAKWTGISVVSLIIVGHLLQLAKTAPPTRIKAWLVVSRFFSLKLLVALLATVLTVLATSPYLLTRVGGYLDVFGLNLARYRLAQTDYSTDYPWLGNLQVLWDDSGLLLLLGLGGLLLALGGRERRNLLLVTYPLIFMLSLNGSRLIYRRNILPITYYLAIMAAVFAVVVLDWLFKLVKNRLSLTSNPQPSTSLSRFRPYLLPAIYPLLLLLTMWSSLTSVLYGDWFNDQPFSYARAEAWLKREAGPGTLKLVEMRSQQWGAYPNVLAVFGDEDKGANDFPLSYYRERGIAYLAINRDRVASRNARNSGNYPELLQPGLIAEEVRTKAEQKPGPAFAIIKTGVTADTIKLEHPLKVDFSGKLALLGFNAGKVEAPNDLYLPPPGAIKNTWPSYKAGEIIGLSVYWQVLAPLQADYVVFIHLVPPAKLDVQVATRDTPPLLGAYPTSQWRTGELVVDRPNLALPADLAPGDYILRMGLYLNDGKFTPLPLSDGSRFVTLGQIKVN